MKNPVLRIYHSYKLAKKYRQKGIARRIANGTYHIGRETTVEIELLDFTGDGSMHFGDNCQIMSHLCTRLLESKITIGNRCFLGMHTTLLCATSITIGNDVMIAGDCYITDNDGHAIDWRIRRQDVMNRKKGFKNWNNVEMSPVSIGNDVWVAPRCIILRGVSIGEAAVIAAGSVVTKSIPPRVIAAGNPARVIREID